MLIKLQLYSLIQKNGYTFAFLCSIFESDVIWYIDIVNLLNIYLICRCKTGWAKWIVKARIRDLSWEIWKVEKYISLPLDILVTKYIKLITKNQFLSLFFSISSKGYLWSNYFKKRPKPTILSLLKNPKNYADKKKSAVLVFRY